MDSNTGHVVDEHGTAVLTPPFECGRGTPAGVLVSVANKTAIDGIARARLVPALPTLVRGLGLAGIARQERRRWSRGSISRTLGTGSRSA